MPFPALLDKQSKKDRIRVPLQQSAREGETMNQVKTVFLMVVLTVILVALGSLIGGKNGAVIAFVAALAMNLVSYWFSDRIVLRMYGAGRLTRPRRRTLEHRRVFVPACVHPHAQGVYHRERQPQCLRHREEPRAQRGRRNHGDPEDTRQAGA